MGKKLAAIALVCTLLAACTTNDTKSTAGEAYGPIDGPFRGRWWSYYERGVSSLAVGSTTLAEEDLRAALAGRSRDAWSARTYGLHFVEYFPNRELGVLYYKKEQYDEAEKYLKASLEAVDTERSRYYLDLITKARIAKGQLNDGSAPTALASSGSVLVASRTVPVDITAQDDIGVSAVRLNGELLPQRGSEKEVTFHQGLTLDEGEHALAVSTTDLADKTTESAINVVVDMTAPAIGIFSPGADAVTQASSVTLRGAAADKHGVIQVSILDGKVLAESTNGERRLDFSTELALQDGANRFIVVAKDKAGNEIRTAVDVFKGQPASAGAKLWKLQQIRPDLLQVALATTDEPGALLAVIDSMLLAQAEAADAPIRIDVSFPDAEPGKPYDKSTIPVKGAVVAKAPLDLLSIKGLPVDVPTDVAPTGDQPVQTAFERNISLDQGTNIIEVAAKDKAGNGTSKRLNVEANPAGEIPAQMLLPVAVMDIGVDTPVGQNLALGVRLSEQLGKSKRFNVLDRTIIDQVLTELKLSASGLVDQSQAVQLGKLASAQVLLNGSLSDFTNELQIKMQVISTQTGQILDTYDALIKDRNSSTEVDEAMKRLAAQVSSKFPKVSGTVRVVKGDELITNISSDEGVFTGMQILVVFKEEPELDPVTGDVLMEGNTTVIGRGEITQVTPTATRAKRVRFDGDAETLEVGMSAITW